MSEQIICEIQFKSQTNGESNPASMHVTTFTKQEQKTRALKSLLIFWTIAALCIFIPIAHLILVPAFLIGGVIVASRRWKTEQEGTEATGSCPACGKKIRIKLDKNADLPQWKDCPECAGSLELQVAPETSET